MLKHLLSKLFGSEQVSKVEAPVIRSPETYLPDSIAFDGSYESWPESQWNQWEQAERTKQPLREDVSKWTKADALRWEQQEWRRITKRAQGNAQATPNLAERKTKRNPQPKPKVITTTKKPTNRTSVKKEALGTLPIDEVGAACVAAKELVFSKLDQAISERLVGHTRMRPHGTYREVLQFNIWDRNQTIQKIDVLNPWFFNYNLVHLPQKHRYSDGKNTWYLALYLNTTRIYRNQDFIKEHLDKKLSKLKLKGFDYHGSPGYFRRNFTYKGKMDEFPEYILPHYLELIGEAHPILMPIIDSFTAPLTDEERRQTIAKNVRITPKAFNQTEIEMLRENSRFIPPSWRKILLEKSGGKCVHCSTKLTIKTARIDHIIPWSKGGPTKLENLQTLCDRCNGTKSNRFSR